MDTRSLSITLLSENDTFDLKPGTNVSQNLALLYYENPIGKVSALLQRVCFNLSVGDLVTSWVDITSQESKSLPDEFRNIPGHGSFSNDSFSNDSLSNTLYESDASATFSTPFASIANFSGGATEVALFYSPPNASFVGSMYDVRSSGPGGFSELPAGHQNTTMQSDVAFFGSEFALQINGTQPATVIGGPEMFPNNELPFARLASVILADQFTFLYHQINGTAFAEEQWDDSAQEWLSPEYITVSDS